MSDAPRYAIYVASPEGDTGKSTIALGILHRLAATVARVGVFRPITRMSEDRDYILELLLTHTTAGLPYEECVGVSYQQLHDDPDAALADIVDRFHHVADRCDAVLVVGSDYTDVATPSELSMNARIAANLGAPVVLAVKARGRTPEQVEQLVEVCMDEIAAQHAHTAAVVVNRCAPAAMSDVAAALRRIEPRSYVLPEEPLLVAPSVAELQAAVEGTVVQGDPALLGREVLDVLVAGMTAEHVLERLTEGGCRRHARRPLRRRAGCPQRPCRRGLSVAVVRHPQRRSASCIRRSKRWSPAWVSGCRSWRPGSGRSRRPAGWRPRAAASPPRRPARWTPRWH